MEGYTYNPFPIEKVSFYVNASPDLRTPPFCLMFGLKDSLSISLGGIPTILRWYLDPGDTASGCNMLPSWILWYCDYPSRHSL